MHRCQVATIKAVKRQIAEMKYTQAVALFNNSGLTIGPQVVTGPIYRTHSFMEQTLPGFC